MMILTKLHLENFKKYTTFEIELTEGLIGIIGKNGSGKSTLFEAILFALYGELKNRKYKEVLRNASASDKDAVLVKLDFEFENTTYQVVRAFRGKALSASAKFYKNGTLMTTGAKEVTHAIIKLIKMSKEAFLHTLFASQKELMSLSILKNEERKKMIRRLLGLEKIDFVENELILTLRELKKEISTVAEMLLSEEEIKSKNESIQQIKDKTALIVKDTEVLEKEILALKSQEVLVKKELATFVTIKEHRQKTHSELELLEKDKKANIQNQNRCERELNILEAKAKELHAKKDVKKEYEVLNLKLKEQEKLKNFHLQKEGLQKEQVQLRVQYQKYKNDIKSLEHACAGYEQMRLKEKEFKTTLAVLLKEITRLKGIEQQLRSELSAENRIVEDTKKKIKNIKTLGRQSPCPTCTRALLDAYDQVIDSLESIVKTTTEEKIDKIKVKVHNTQTALEKAEIEQKKLEKSLQEISQSLTLIQSKQKDLERAKEAFVTVREQGTANNEALKALEGHVYDEKVHISLLRAMETLKIQYEHVLRLEAELKREADLKAEWRRFKEALKVLDEQLKNKQEAYQNIHYDEKEHQVAQKALETLQQSKEEKLDQLNRLKIQIARYDGEIKTLQNDFKQNEIGLAKVQKKKDDMQDYEKIKVSLGAFKTRLNAKVAPRISEIASQMYASITKGKYQYIEVSNDFDFYIYDEGAKYPIERFSGGEVDLANLVLRIAISKTLGELNGASRIGFLAFDEVFGSQDESRRMQILEAFHLIKEQYRQIFLISHEMEIKEMFERVIEL
ncbi:SMC family ATPase [Sulfurospirillum sp. 1612]|uniref:SMC family ATPase n=1 Tax=Sulfurospirillum sp. 1612 TaxID=3094835 RepID=UPI002F95AB40